MANAETKQLDSIISSRRAMLAVGGAALASLAFTPKAKAAALNDFDILNFALNLEYLEAQFYNLAVYGVTIDQLTTPIPVAVNGGTAGKVTVKANPKVAFTNPLIQAYATETAAEEAKHVSFLQTALTTNAVSMPDINLLDSFNALGQLAIGSAFDPFGANGALSADASFLLGAYIFEDTGVSAYHGAAPLISDKKTIFPAALGIHAVEAYHAGLIRTSIAQMDVANGNTTLGSITQAISKVRFTLSELGNSAAASTDAQDDFGVTIGNVQLNGSTANQPAYTIANANPATSATLGTGFNSIAKGRSTSEILAIVTGAAAPSSGPSKGGFFPSGLNGTIQ